jgi:hypothetical protein
MEDNEEEEESPTELNTITGLSGFVVISPDKLSLKYTGVSQHGHDVGVVQANKPAPCKRFAYYFEIYVKDAGVKGRVSIGFTTNSFRIARHPGYDIEFCLDLIRFLKISYFCLVVLSLIRFRIWFNCVSFIYVWLGSEHTKVLDFVSISLLLSIQIDSFVIFLM